MRMSNEISKGFEYVAFRNQTCFRKAESFQHKCPSDSNPQNSVTALRGGRGRAFKPPPAARGLFPAPGPEQERGQGPHLKDSVGGSAPRLALITSLSQRVFLSPDFPLPALVLGTLSSTLGVLVSEDPLHPCPLPLPGGSVGPCKLTAVWRQRPSVLHDFVSLFHTSGRTLLTQLRSLYPPWRVAAETQPLHWCQTETWDTESGVRWRRAASSDLTGKEGCHSGPLP